MLTKDAAGRIAQYDYGWFVGYNGARPNDAIGYVDASESYGVGGGFPGADAPSLGTEKTVFRW